MEWNSKRALFVVVISFAVTVAVIIAAVLATILTTGPPREKTWINGDYVVGDINIAIVHADNKSVTFQQLKFLDSEDYAYQYRAVGRILKVGGPDIKKWVGPAICFTLFSTKSGWARAHTLPTALNNIIIFFQVLTKPKIR